MDVGTGDEDSTGEPDGARARCYDRPMEGFAVLLALLALVVAGVALAFVLRSQREGDAITGGARLKDLERRLAQVGQRVEVLEAELDARRGSTGRATERATPVRSTVRGPAAISRIGLVRFDAFADAGGAQSFALALVDDDGDGIILSSLHSRPTTRVYVKALRRGIADAPLSGEEEQALRQAGITT